MNEHRQSCVLGAREEGLPPGVGALSRVSQGEKELAGPSAQQAQGWAGNWGELTSSRAPAAGKFS